MLRRLLLALLLACFSLPAAAAAPPCHDEAAGAAMRHDMHSAMRPARDAPAEQAPGAHVCVGCVPLADWMGARIAPRIVPRAPLIASPVPRLDLGGAPPPPSPPPQAA